MKPSTGSAAILFISGALLIVVGGCGADVVTPDGVEVEVDDRDTSAVDSSSVVDSNAADSNAADSNAADSNAADSNADGGDAPDTTPPPDVPATVPSARIVFSADFATNAGCATHKNGGCDVYAATIDFAGNVSHVTRLTTADDPEVFPVLSVDGATAYAEALSATGKGTIVWASVDGTASGTLLTSAVGPAPLADGKTLLYLSLPGYRITLADFASPTALTMSRTASPETGFHEPHVGPGGQAVFYRLSGGGRGSNTAQAVVFDPLTSELTPATEQDGTAHCFWDGLGQAIFCNNAGVHHGIFSIPLPGTSGSTFVLNHPPVSKVAAVDSDFAACKATNYAYGTFCDPTHVIVTVGCELETDGVVDGTYSKLGMIDIADPTLALVPLGKELADAFGGPGSSSYTVDCLVR